MAVSKPSGAPPPRPRLRGFWWWFRRVGLGFVVSVLLLAVAGFAYQTIATASDRDRFPPPGQLVDIGGYRLHIQCLGSVHPGVATVILEAGTSLSSPAWALVQAQVSSTTRICAYDRAGNGWSEPGPPPRDARQIAGELHTLLDRAAIKGPYVLVGHSFGGMYVRAYADAHPSDVVGLVLVDSSHPDQLTRSPTRSAQLATFKRVLSIAPFLARIGIVRLTGAGDAPSFDLPLTEQAQLNAFGAVPEQSTTTLAELDGFQATSDLLHAAASLGARPLFVLSAGKDADPDFPELQADLVTLSSNSVRRVVDGADHVSLVFSKAGATAVSAAILAVLESARTGRPIVR